MKKWGNDTWRAGAILLLCLFLFASAAWAETDVTTMVKINPGRLLYDRLTKQSYLDVSATNISTDVLLTPVKVVIDSVSPSTVTVANADGVTDDGKPYFEYGMSDSQLPAGATTPVKRWKFANPTATRFTYTTAVLGAGYVNIPATTKVIDTQTIQSLSEVSPDGETFIFEATTPQLQDVTAGEILVFGVSRTTPQGTLRRVVDRYQIGDTVFLATEQATIAEALENCSISVSQMLSPGDVLSGFP
ncbi:MAG: hypothetical protein ACOY4H_11780 [Thermodesulfobacteriota bacterium]